MKNLKVGAKIFVGFAAVVLMMALMSGTVVATTLMINRDAASIKISSDLQTAVNNTRNAAALAQGQAGIIYNVTNQDANDGFAAYDAEVRQLAGQALTLAKANDETTQYVAGIEAFQAAYDGWSQNVKAVIAANDRLTDLGNQGVEQAAEVYAFFDSGLRGLTDASGIAAYTDGLEDMGDIREGLAHIRDTFDGAEADALKASIDEVIVILTGRVATTPASQAARDACESMKALIDTFVAENDDAWTLVNATEDMGDSILEQISTLSFALDGDMDSDITSTISLANTTIWIVVAVAVVAIAVAVVMGMVISRLITVPTKGLSFSLKYLAETGSLELPADVQKLAAEIATRKDELGETAVSYGMLMQRLGYISGELDKIAEGDLTSEIKLASDDDAMGRSLSLMLEKLNAMFGRINTATAQVSTGAKQIADGAQSLAQGSTEQAASVEELSASIGSVASQTEENAGMAHDAAKLADTIKAGAEKSSSQMEQMMQAVTEITDASQKISNVIKVIDDIAFQTNILALNAAVEAARAGQHGKGFAVVAEEVRNLAGKSAEAAKDTGNMIANSIEKATLGANIARETSASLSEIVEGINRSNQLVGDIAASSNAQSDAIREINIGIDQVAQVVQQNSATAEESAAASEEMNGQADMLEQLVAQFKLAGGSSHQPAQISGPADYQLEAYSAPYQNSSGVIF